MVYGTLAALKRMLQRDQGVIVQVGSALAYRSIPLQSAYCAAKHAIAGFTDSLRCELMHDKSNIRLTMVRMPALNTPQFGWVKSRLRNKAQPVPPIFEPEVGASAVYWAAHHHRREVYVGWPTVAAIIANKNAPGITRSVSRAHRLRIPANISTGEIRTGQTTYGNRWKGTMGHMEPRQPRTSYEL